jgi:hypothetical protein
MRVLLLLPPWRDTYNYDIFKKNEALHASHSIGAWIPLMAAREKGVAYRSVTRFRQEGKEKKTNAACSLFSILLLFSSFSPRKD